YEVRDICDPRCNYRQTNRHSFEQHGRQAVQISVCSTHAWKCEYISALICADQLIFGRERSGQLEVIQSDILDQTFILMLQRTISVQHELDLRQLLRSANQIFYSLLFNESRNTQN